MSDENKLLTLTQNLLDAVVTSDYNTYSLLCSEEMTSFEPEAKGTLVDGKEFHKWFLDQEKKQTSENSAWKTNICQPKVRMLGTDAAVVAYIRIDQINKGEVIETRKFEETRVWQMINGVWTMVHFHRSEIAK